jgi:hypothetical protein
VERGKPRTGALTRAHLFDPRVAQKSTGLAGTKETDWVSILARAHNSQIPLELNLARGSKIGQGRRVSIHHDSLGPVSSHPKLFLPELVWRTKHIPLQPPPPGRERGPGRPY